MPHPAPLGHPIIGAFASKSQRRELSERRELKRAGNNLASQREESTRFESNRASCFEKKVAILPQSDQSIQSSTGALVWTPCGGTPAEAGYLTGLLQRAPQ
jgi:hypothetical protein